MKVFIWFSDKGKAFEVVHSALTEAGSDDLSLESFYEPEDPPVQPDPAETSDERIPQDYDPGKNLIIWNIFLIRYCEWSVTKKAT
jgi:hypothetical protein